MEESQSVFCTKCGQKTTAGLSFCSNCGAPQSAQVASPAAPRQIKQEALPEGVAGWSWGAFFLNWIWAIGNKTWIGLLALIPYVNLIMMVVLGIKGREWAWKNKTWDSVEEFNRIQKKWNTAGWIVFAVSCVLGIILGGVLIMEDRMKHSSKNTRISQAEPYETNEIGKPSQKIDISPVGKFSLGKASENTELNTNPPRMAKGFLEKGKTHFALLNVSGESGDLYGYVFKAQSTVGKEILKKCLPGFMCEIEKAKTIPFDMALFDSEIHGNPSSLDEIIEAKGVYMASFTSDSEQKTNTRYGEIRVQEDEKILLFKGKPIMPAIQGNSSLSIIATYERGDHDVLLIQNTGGTACPALFHIVSVSEKGVSATPEFGTCSDIIYPAFEEDSGITLFMAGFVGKATLLSDKEAEKEVMTKHAFRWSPKSGLTEDGKPLP